MNYIRNSRFLVHTLSQNLFRQFLNVTFFVKKWWISSNSIHCYTAAKKEEDSHLYLYASGNTAAKYFSSPVHCSQLCILKKSAKQKMAWLSLLMQLNWLNLIGSPEYKKLLSGIIQLQPVAVKGGLWRHIDIHTHFSPFLNNYLYFGEHVWNNLRK